MYVKVWRCFKLAKILVTSAWPYINYTPHLGTLIPILSADVIARYFRLKGDDVIFVSGSDEHGTPIEIEAVKQGIAPKELTDRNHRYFTALLSQFAISFDNYSRTENPNHKKFVKEHHIKIYDNGYISSKETNLPFCPKCERFLPDRFIEGICPNCGFENARGDQCDKCSLIYDPLDLLDPYCTICKTKPIIKKVKHWYFNMNKIAEQLTEYVKLNKNLAENTKNFTLKILEEGLKARSITRDTSWGIKAPFKGAENKTIYGWFENVLGYISATIEYSKNIKNPEKWKEFWYNSKAKTYYFIGKDNIIFHTILLPALLLATEEGYNLPTNVIANEFLVFQGEDFSKSRRIGIWVDEALKLFPADFWRYTLLSIRPETRDVDFTWKIFLEKVNSDLNDTIGNFVHRTLTFINSRFNNEIPTPQLKNEDIKTLKNAEKKFRDLFNNLDKFKFQSAVKDFIELAHIGNKYFNLTKPWLTFKTNIQLASNTIYVVIQIVKFIAIAMKIFMPFTSEKLLDVLNIDFKQLDFEVIMEPFPLGHKIKKAKLLFNKIEYNEEELMKMLENIRSEKKYLPMEDFKKISLQIGKIIKAEKIPNSDKLLKLLIDIGKNERKKAIAGIAEFYSTSELLDRLVVVVTNLEPKKLFGIESQVMLLASEDKNGVVLIQPEKKVIIGSKIR